MLNFIIIGTLYKYNNGCWPLQISLFSLAIMKLSLVILISFCAIALSVPTTEQGKHAKNEKTFLERQKHILYLFYRVLQHEHINPDYEQIGKNFSILEYAESYSKQDVVKKFLQFWKNGFLPRRAVFSIMNKDHMEQAVALTKLLYYAKDWDTFFKTAVWARQNVNEAMFVYAFTVALVNRPDTRDFMIPPIYEVFPHYFFSTDVIHHAQVWKQRHDPSSHGKTHHTIVSNYSGWYLNLHPEQSMSYYLEDVGINAFYYYLNIYYPSWLESEDFGWKGSRRGEVFYYVTQQMLAHYYSERLSNGFGEIPFIDWDGPVETPYEPSLAYPNALPFPSRPKFANLHEYFYNYGQRWSNSLYGMSHNLIKDFEHRINEAIDSGVIFKRDHSTMQLNSENAMEILGNLIQSNAESPNRMFYGDIMTFARHLLGYSLQPLDEQKLAPSVLEHFETSMRDPIFYQLLKKIFYKFERYMALHVPPYTEKDLVIPGVKVTNMEVDPLITYNDYFYSDLDNAVFYYPTEKFDFRVRARQTRLNHKPFNVKIYINSDKERNVIIKLYMAPKFDEWNRELNLTENRRNMMELDHWMVDLKTGDNVVTKNSQEFVWFEDDRKGIYELYESTVNAIENNGELVIDGRQNFAYWPKRYMIPKGSRGGTAFQFVVFVQSCEKCEIHKRDPLTVIPPGTPQLFLDDKPLLYPFERIITHEKMWHHIPNIYFHDEMIFFKDNVNSSQQ